VSTSVAHTGRQLPKNSNAVRCRRRWRGFRRRRARPLGAGCRTRHDERPGAPRPAGPGSPYRSPEPLRPSGVIAAVDFQEQRRAPQQRSSPAGSGKGPSAGHAWGPPSVVRHGVARRGRARCGVRPRPVPVVAMHPPRRRVVSLRQAWRPRGSGAGRGVKR
jgi:hypothetical protein